MIIKEIAEQASMVLKISLIAVGLFLSFMLFLGLFLYVPPFTFSVLFLFGAIALLGTFIMLTMPMFFLYRQVKMDVHTPDGAIVNGVLWWFILYLLLCIWITLVLNHFVANYIAATNNQLLINRLIDKMGFCCCPLGIALTSPVSILGFYFKRWIHTDSL